MLREKGQNELNALNSTDQLPEWYYRYLGRKGDLTSLLKQLGTLSSEERPAMGKVINEVKQELQESFELRQKTLQDRTSCSAKAHPREGRALWRGFFLVTKRQQQTG